VELVSCEVVKRRVPARSRPAFRKPPINVSQGELLPPTLDEMVPSEDPCRLVVKLISLLDLSVLKKDLCLQGAPSYPVEIMLALEMLSKWDGEFGSRRVEKRCKYDTRYKWVVQGHTPDHTTIWRFRRALGESMDELLAESVKLGKKAGLESLGRASIDGTDSPEEAISQPQTPDEPEALAEVLPESESPSEPENADAPDVSEVPESPEEAALRMISRSKKSKKKKRVPLPFTDPDARTMKTRQGQYIVGYNAQALVDMDTNLITAVHVCNEASDAGLLEPTLEKYLELHRELPCELLADAGYDTPNNAQVIADLGIDACVSCRERNPFWRLDEQNRPICPMGHVAVYKDKFKKDVPVVRFVVKECPACPLRVQCLAKEESKHRTLSVDASADVALWIRQKHKAKSEEGKARLKERASTIEFGFARMKERLKFRRLTMWGLEGSGTEVGIVALAMNLAIIGAKAGLDGLEAVLAACILLYCALDLAYLRFYNRRTLFPNRKYLVSKSPFTVAN